MKQQLNEALSVLKEDGLFALIGRVSNHIKHRFPHKANFLQVSRYRREYNLSLEAAAHLVTYSERPIVEDLLSSLETDDVFFDVGANRGAYSLKAAELLGEGQVVAFEPGSVVEELEKKAAQRGLEVRVFKKAVSSEIQSSFGYRYDENGYFMKGSPDEGDEERSIAAVNGHDIIDQDIPLPTVVKIDVNGWDLDALRALRPVIGREQCRLVYIEAEPPDAFNTHRHPNLHELQEDEISEYFQKNWSFDEILQILSGANLKLTYLTDESGDLVIKAFR